MKRTGIARSLGLVSLVVFFVIGACAPSPAAPTAAPAKAPPTTAPAKVAEPAAKQAESAAKPAAASAEWDAVVAAARQEGVVVRSSFTPSRGGEENMVKRFEEVYGIRVEETSARAGDFMARYQAEMAAGKPTVDVRTSGSSECRMMASQGQLESFGTLPAAVDPTAPWIVDPLIDVKNGHGHTLVRTLGVWWLPVNARMISPEMEPRTFKDLADPKFRGMIVLDEPGPTAFGTLWAATAWDLYGEQYIRGTLANVKALSRSAQEAMTQTMQGQYGIYIMANAGALVDLMKIPEPRPVRLVAPEDGYMASLGAACMPKGAPHPNAARLFMNWTLTQEANQILANAPGASLIRRDVTLADPVLTPQVKPDIKFFHENPNSYDFQIGKFFEYGDKTSAMLPEFGLK